MVTITEDRVSDRGTLTGLSIEEMPLFALERMMGEPSEIPNEGPTVRFQMFDDDGELYFSGTLTDDDECLNQTAALRWGKTEAGCTTIKVRRGNAWVQEIA